MEYSCRNVNKSVGAGINTLMSIFDGLKPSIFCRKMEKARPMREEMDGKVVYFPPESALLPLMLYFSTVLLPYLYFDLACKQLCFPPGKSINKRKESTTGERCINFHSLSREDFILFQELFRIFSKLSRIVSNLLQNEGTLIID